MHSEIYNIDEEAAHIINRARDEGGRIIAVNDELSCPGDCEFW